MNPNEPKTESTKSLQELNLLDDFLFDVATEDLEACQIMIELSMGITLKSIRWKEGIEYNLFTAVSKVQSGDLLAVISEGIAIIKLERQKVKQRGRQKAKRKNWYGLYASL